MVKKHIVDLLTIPIYREMTQVFYVDRCMVKWVGLILYEHSEQMKENEGNKDQDLCTCFH